MLIALTGKKQSGKTEAASYLVGRGFARINFKDSLIEELIEKFPDLLEEIHKITFSPGMNYEPRELFKQKTPLVRRLLQNYGTNVRRRDNEFYWVNRWVNKYLFSLNEDVVVDDCRFLNEAETIRNQKGIIIRIERDSISKDSHISETEMDLIQPDFVITNDGSLLDLYIKIEEVLKKLKK
jgi:dephospho-CoA kinase